MRDSAHEESFKSILALLASESLLEDNQEEVNKLNNPELGCTKFLRAVEYLNKVDLLDQESLSRCLKITQIKPIHKPSFLF